MKTKIIAVFIISVISFQFLFAQDQTPIENIHFATLQGNIEAIKSHIEAGTDLNEKDQFGSTPLIIASIFNKPDVAELLLSGGADIDVADLQGSTPLHIATFFCYEEMLKLLIDNGADKFIRNNEGATAYDVAASPVEMDKNIYEDISLKLSPLGFSLNYNLIHEKRAKLKKYLKSDINVSGEVNYTPANEGGWKISQIPENEINRKILDEIYVEASKLPTLYSLLIIKNGELIAEKYFHEGSITQLSKRASVTKSFISALMGIAIDKGFIPGINQKMIKYFPEEKNKIKDERKLEITIKQMLQMRAGFPWEESDTSYWNAVWTGDYIKYISEFPLVYEPGTDFQYSNLTSHWLGIIIANSVNNDLASFGQEYLFSPLNMKLGNWIKDIYGYNIGCGDIEFTSRDLAKFGLLYLNKGKFKGKQIISEKWIDESLKNYSPEINTPYAISGRLGRYFNDVGYGYQWWSAKVGDHNLNFAWGHGGQLIVLIKDLDMVIVTTADPYYGKEKHFQSWKNERSILNLVGKFISLVSR